MHPFSAGAFLLTVGFSAGGFAQPAAAQADTAQAVLFEPRDAVGILGVTGLTLGAMAVDESLARRLQRGSVQTNGALKGTANVFNAVGFPGSVLLIAGTYFYGLAEHSRPIATLGMHTGEAVVLAGMMDEILKGAIGRARPYVDVTNSRDYHPGRGFSNDDYASLPSAHVTFAFAAAAMTSREVSRSWPEATGYVTTLSYGAATLVGFARVYKNQHWASDVVGAAGVGIYAGVLFDRYNRGHPNNIFDRTFLPVSIVPEQRGAALTWAIPLQY